MKPRAYAQRAAPGMSEVRMRPGKGASHALNPFKPEQSGLRFDERYLW
jgi:hypothetical protein